MSRLWIVSLILAAALAPQASCGQGESTASSTPAASAAHTAPPGQARRPQVPAPEQKLAAQALGSVAGLLVENRGQWDGKIRYAVTGRAVSVALTDSGMIYQLVKAASTPAQTGAGRPRVDSTAARLRRPGAERPEVDSSAARPRRPRAESTDVSLERLAFSVSFDGSRPTQPKGVDAAKSRIFYYAGKDAAEGQNAVATFKGARYEGLYDGVDLTVRPGGWGVKCEFDAAPGVPAERIVLKYDGITGMMLDDAGRLHVNTAFGELAYDAPAAWQESGGERKTVSVKMRLVGKDSCGFEIAGPLDTTLPLVISL